MSPEMNNSSGKKPLDSYMYRAIAALGMCTAIGFLFAFMGFYQPNNNSQKRQFRTQDTQDFIFEKLINNVDPAQIKENLRVFTQRPHIAGTPANYKVADKIAEIWRTNGLEDVHFVKYNVLLSYPNYSKPNHVAIVDDADKIVFQSSGLSPVILPDEQGAPGAGIQWLAYSANGSVEGDLVYCHFGRQVDFQKLEQMGVSVKGKIAVLRYNKEFRGSKVKHAAKHGAIGAILYSDPKECAMEGTTAEHVYPSTVWMPPKGVQRGSLMIADGDVLTPLYPSRADLYGARTIEEAKEVGLMPDIPVIPLSYSDAYELLSRLDGKEVPVEWAGGLNITYKTGPGFIGPVKYKTRVTVHAFTEIKEIRNVIGYIYGREEPDEYVMLGNHFDAWVYGSIDPNSGTATLAEVGRAFTQTIKETGWRPARTLVFCAWDAEEYGLIGSTEFVEDFANILSDRAIVYLNVDLISSNSSLSADTIPSMYQAVVDASKKIPNPMKTERDAGRKTVYDTWIQKSPSQTPYLPDYPNMKVPGGGSDHQPFLVYMAIPVVDFLYTNYSGTQYPLYHSLYETPFVNEHLFDIDNFAVHRAIGQYWAELARSFADADILPFNTTIFAQKLLDEYFSDLKKKMEPLKNMPEIHDASSQLSKLIAKAQEFLHRAKKFDSVISKQNEDGFGSWESRRIVSGLNRRLKAVDRCFQNPRGMEGAACKRHVLFSLNGEDTYSGVVMAAIYQKIANVEEAPTTEEKAKAARELAIQISIVQYSMQCAINTLNNSI